MPLGGRLGGRWVLLVFVVRNNFGELSASFLSGVSPNPLVHQPHVGPSLQDILTGD
jgi:hypothetical protein